MSSTVVAANPRSTKSPMAASTMACSVIAFFRARCPPTVIPKDPGWLLPLLWHRVSCYNGTQCHITGGGGHACRGVGRDPGGCGGSVRVHIGARKRAPLAGGCRVDPRHDARRRPPRDGDGAYRPLAGDAH